MRIHILLGEPAENFESKFRQVNPNSTVVDTIRLQKSSIFPVGSTTGYKVASDQLASSGGCCITPIGFFLL